MLTGSSEAEILKVKRFLDYKFTIKDLNFVKYFLGLEITRSHDGIYFNQRKYILDMLEDASLLGCKSVPTLLPKGVRLLQ